MKVYLDDVREAPPGWFRAYWPQQVIHLISTAVVTDISLDHDLGNDSIGTGYDVLTWLEETVAEGLLDMVPNIIVHTANPIARERMLAAVEYINNVSKDRPETW